MSNRRRVLIGLMFVGVLAAVAVLLPEYTSLEVLVRRETRLRESIANNPFQSWMIGFGVYFLASLVPGTGGKSMIFGWLFGLWSAVLMIDAALTLAALTTFFICRYLIRDVVESRFTGHVERLNRHLARDGPFYLLQLRMAHAPFTFINYVSGALRVPARTFWWTTQLGLLPGTIVFVFAGTRLPTLHELADQGLIRLLDPWLIAGLLLTAILPVAVRSLSRLLHIRRLRRTDSLT
ncbi:MAG: TVP38/TMEM64 family protein [Rhodopirellula sp.]|nr:TVP38/TMEM64 family protein [Rhodopirellula sp.]